MGAELFAMSWVQSVVLFFSYLGWALFAIGLVVRFYVQHISMHIKEDPIMILTENFFQN